MKLSTPRQAWSLLTKTVTSWSKDYAPSMGAALAFYTMFSIAPMLLIVTQVVGYFFGAKAASGEIVSQLGLLVGQQAAHAIEALVVSASDSSRRSIWASVSIVVFLVASMSVFNELQDSLNRIWRSPRSVRASGILPFLRARLVSLLLILAISLLFMVSLIASAVFAAFGKLWGPAGSPELALFAQFANILFGFGLITVMFAFIYKYVPQRKVKWHDTWVGAATTSMLFTLGKALLGIYLGRTNLVSTYGAVGYLAIFLLWVYYSAQIFLLGAEFTWIYSNEFGRHRNRLPHPDEAAGAGKAAPAVAAAPESNSRTGSTPHAGQ